MKRVFSVFILSVVSILSTLSCVYADVVYEGSGYGGHGVNPAVTRQDVILVGILLLYFLQFFARGRMLDKRGAEGWKIIVPFYGRYLEYKTYWESKYFWVNFGISTFLLMVVTALYYSENNIYSSILTILFFIGTAIYVIIIILLRRNSLCIFGYSKNLAFLEIFGLGFILDFICGFFNRKTDKPGEGEKILLEPPASWE